MRRNDNQLSRRRPLHLLLLLQLTCKVRQPVKPLAAATKQDRRLLPLRFFARLGCRRRVPLFTIIIIRVVRVGSNLQSIQMEMSEPRDDTTIPMCNRIAPSKNRPEEDQQPAARRRHQSLSSSSRRLQCRDPILHLRNNKSMYTRHESSVPLPADPMATHTLWMHSSSSRWLSQITRTRWRNIVLSIQHLDDQELLYRRHCRSKCESDV